MDVLVSDTSVLIDLERGLLLPQCFRLPFRFVVPDVLYERELAEFGGDSLLAMGLEILVADANTVAQATIYNRQVPALSAPDAFAIALAKHNGWALLAGDGALRKLARAEKMSCHGTLWVLDQLYETQCATTNELHDGLSAIHDHPRCRLPAVEIRKRLNQFSPE